MYPTQLFLSVILISGTTNVAKAGKLEDDVVKTARVAFRGSLEPVIVCHSSVEQCNFIVQAVQNAGIVISNWSLEGFRLKLNSLKREILLKYDAILVVINNLETLEKAIQDTTLVHSRARYVIAEAGDDSGTSASQDCCRSDGPRLFQKLWIDKRMHRIVVLGPRCPGFALTADIFEADRMTCMHKISTDDACQLTTVLTRQIKDMNGQVLRISMSHTQDLRVIQSDDGIPYEGVDATILREFVKFLNFTAEVTGATDDKPYAFTFPNGTMVGSAVDLTTGKTDIVFNGNFMYYLGSTPAQISKWYKEDALCVVIKKAGKVPNVVALFTPFSAGFVWAVITMIWLAGSVLYGIRSFIHSPKWEQLYLFDSVASIAGFMVEYPMTYNRRSNPERFLLVSCSLWAVVVMGTYQGCLRGTLTIPKDLKDIDTLLELDQNGYTIYVTSENLKTVFRLPGNPLGESLVRRTVLVNSTLPIVLNGGEFVGTLTRKESAHRRVRPHEHLVRECVRRSELSFFMRIGSPATWALNRMLSRFCEAGIIEFFCKTERREQEIKDQRLIAKTSHRERFTLEDVQGAFLILGVGTVMNIVIFGVELMEGGLPSDVRQRRRMELLLSRKPTRDVLSQRQRLFRGDVHGFMVKNSFHNTKK